MAKGQQPQNLQPHQTRERQRLLSFSTTCTLALLLLFLMRLDSGGVDALSISLDGNGNRLQQQQQQQQQPNDLQQQTQQQQQLENADNGEEHNYVMQKSTTELVPNSGEILEDEDNVSSKGNGIDGHLSRSQLNYGHSLQTLNMIKRAPGGFVGMRGKKNANENSNDYDFDDDGYDSLPLPWQQLHSNENVAINWNDYVQSNSQRYKKAPNAFYGVRGKKFTIGNGVNPSGDHYRWQQFLQKLDEERVRDMIMDDFVNGLLDDDNAGQLPNEMSKRAPTGFTGMRGKRPSLSLAGAGDMMSDEMVGKRGLGNTFVGVRGKKDVSHQTFKRSPLGGSERYFFDFWKKSSAAGGAGGKRQRFLDFGNKFVAVRGKKSSYGLLDDEDDDEMTPNYWNNIYRNNNSFKWSPASSSSTSSGRTATSADDAMRLLYANNGKRAPNGFTGMRGKRPFISDEMQTMD